MARLDLGNHWLEMDMLSAAFADSGGGEEVALFRHVPPGTVTLSVMRGHDLLCEQQLQIELNGGLVEAECRAVADDPYVLGIAFACPRTSLWVMSMDMLAFRVVVGLLLKALLLHG